MNKSSIRARKEELTQRRSDLQAQKAQSEYAANNVRELLPNLSPEKVERLKAVGIDITPIINVDFDLLISDPEYHSRFMGMLESLDQQIADFTSRGLAYNESQFQS